MKFKDLEEEVSHKINVNLMPFEVRTDYIKVTERYRAGAGDGAGEEQGHHLRQNKDGIQRGTVNIFGRVTAMTGRDGADLRGHGAGGRSQRIAAEDHGALVALLEGGAAASRNVIAWTWR